MLIDELIEKAFCEGYEYAQKEFGKKKYREDRKRERLEDIDSHRGLGRAATIGLLTNNLPATLIGGYMGKKKAEELDDEGKSDHEIKRGAGKHAAKWGAGIGAAMGAAGSAASAHLLRKFGIPVSRAAATASGALGGALWGGTGAYLGARKNTEKRIEKRILKERD